MDYSKQGGGTRILDQLEARTLATGHGQSVAGARATGSARAERVVAGMKPGQHVSDPGLAQVHRKKLDDAAACCMDPPPEGPKSVQNEWPLTSGSKSHHEANGALKTPAAMPDQGEEHRRPTTGQTSKVIQAGVLSRAGR